MDIGISRPGDELLGEIGNSKGGKAVVRAKLSAPAGCDSIRAASNGAAAGLRSVGSGLDGVCA